MTETTHDHSSWAARHHVPPQTWVQRVIWLLIAAAIPTVIGILLAQAKEVVTEPRLLDATTRCVPAIDGSQPNAVCRIEAMERRVFAGEQWDRDTAALQVATMASHVRFEAALYERDARKRFLIGHEAELRFMAEATPILADYWSKSADERRNYDLARRLSTAQQRSLGTAGAAPPE